MRFAKSWDIEPSGIDPLRVGCIGAGDMAEFAVFPAMYYAPIAIQAVCDINEHRASHLSSKIGNVPHYANHREMFNREELEAVIIQMHPGPRLPLVQESLKKGYHVFIPKPPAMSLDETAGLSQLARETGKILMVNFQSRFSYGVTQARKLIRSNSFGRLTQYHASFCSGPYSGENSYRSTGYADPIEAYLLDFSIHHLDLARFLAGEVVAVSSFYDHNGTNCSIALTLKFENGTVGTLQLNSNRIWWRNYDRIELTGDGEYIILDCLWNLKHYTKDGNTFSENYRDERSAELTGDAGAFREFVDAVRSDREPIANIHDCLRTMRLYQFIHDAVREGRDGVLFDETQSF